MLFYWKHGSRLSSTEFRITKSNSAYNEFSSEPNTVPKISESLAEAIKHNQVGQVHEQD